LGVRAVIVESFERIHRSNLIGMGVLPLQYAQGENAASLGLTGHEVFSIGGLDELNHGSVPKEVPVTIERPDGSTFEFSAEVRIDTPMEAEYYRHGGILRYVLRQLAG
jgi:aconitate hydratase